MAEVQERKERERGEGMSGERGGKERLRHRGEVTVGRKSGGQRDEIRPGTL